MNEDDHQVRVAHKILGYDPIQKSFAALKYVIKAKDPRLQKITVTEHGFFFPERCSAEQVVETKEGTKVKSRSSNWTSLRMTLTHSNNWIRPRILLVT